MGLSNSKEVDIEKDIVRIKKDLEKLEKLFYNMIIISPLLLVHSTQVLSTLSASFSTHCPPVLHHARLAMNTVARTRARITRCEVACRSLLPDCSKPMSMLFSCALCSIS